MIETYKYLTGKYTTERPKWITNNNQNRGNNYKLMKTRAKEKTRTNFLTNRVVNDWNKLPASVVQAETVNQFKNQLDNHWNNDEELFQPSCL